MDASVLGQSDGHFQRLAATIPQRTKKAYLLRLSEADFRDKIVRPLFKRLGYTDGRDTCGALEQGIDAYFTRHDELSGTDVFAIQTKVGRISKSAKTTDNLDSIVTQLRTAAATPILLIAARQRRLPIKIWLIASGDILPAAEQFIVTELPDPRLEFMGASQLIPLVDRHCPELWLNIDSELLPYFRSLRQLLESGEGYLGSNFVAAPRDAVADGEPPYTVIHVYPEPKPPPPSTRRQKKRTLPKLNDFPVTSIIKQREPHILILGEGGSGKSTALKRIMYEIAIKPTENPASLIVPVFLRASDIATDPTKSLIEHAASAISRINPTLKMPFSNDDLEAGRVMLLVDALDELPSEDIAIQVLGVINNHSSKYDRTKIIITSRSTNFVKSDPTLASYARFFVAPLSANQITQLVKSHSRNRNLAVHDSSEVLRRLNDIHGIEMSPMIVSIFLATTDSNRTDVPANITELFKKYTEQMLGRWDETKGLEQQIQAPVKDFVLSQIAFRIHKRRATSIGINEFRSEVLNELTTRGLHEQGELLYDEILVRSNLFRVIDDQVSFKHLIFQEFFAGRAIAESSLVPGLLGDDWWRSAIVFYFGDNPREIIGLRNAAASLDSRGPQGKLNAIVTLGLALQASYLSPVEDKATVYEDIIMALTSQQLDVFGSVEAVRDHPLSVLSATMYIARESLALSSLKFIVEDVVKKLSRSFGEGSASSDEALFWLIIGLISSGAHEVARTFIANYRPEKPHYLFVIFISLLIERFTRLSSNESRDFLDRIIGDLRDRVTPIMPKLRLQFDSEMKSLGSAKRPVLSGGTDSGAPIIPEGLIDDVEVVE